MLMTSAVISSYRERLIGSKVEGPTMRKLRERIAVAGITLKL
jgi:hypothetical protein